MNDDLPQSAPVEVVPQNSMRDLYEQALSELQSSCLEDVKALIKERISEIQRLEALLEKAKADLEKLMQKDPSEVALWRQPGRKLLKGL
jgi:DNA-binding protein H-NS